MNRRTITLSLLVVWAALVAVSVYVPQTLPAEGEGFTRGLNRVLAFLGFQFGAGLFAIIILLFRPRHGTLAIVATLPFVLSVLLFAALIGLIAWSRMA